MVKKTILLVARWPVGGIKTYFRYMLLDPALSKYKFVLVSPDVDVASYISKMDLPVEFYPCERSNVDLLKTARRALEECKPVIVHSHGFTAGALIEPLSWFFSFHHIMTSHDVYLDSQFQGVKGRLKKYILQQIMRSIEIINPVGQEAKDNLLQHMPRLDRSKVRAIRNGVDTSFFSRAIADPIRTDIGVPGEVVLIGFFGRFMAQKGFRYLVDAVELLVRDSNLERRFVILTYGWGGFIREDFADIEKRGLSEYFIQMPHTDNMPGAIKAMDLVVMPSLWEACPLQPMEVLSVGVPFIGTDCIGLHEVIEDTPAQMVPVRDAKALAKAMLMEIEGNRKGEFEAFAPVARERFSACLAAEKLAALYDDVAGR